MDRKTLNKLFKAKVKEAGGVTAFAHISATDSRNVSSMFHGRIPVQGTVLDHLGLKRILTETFIPLKQRPIVPPGHSVFKKVRMTGRKKTLKK